MSVSGIGKSETWEQKMKEENRFRKKTSELWSPRPQSGNNVKRNYEKILPTSLLHVPCNDTFGEKLPPQLASSCLSGIGSAVDSSRWIYRVAYSDTEFDRYKIGQGLFDGQILTHRAKGTYE